MLNVLSERVARAGWIGALLIAFAVSAGGDQTPAKPEVQVPAPKPPAAVNEKPAYALPDPVYPTAQGVTKKFVFEQVFGYEVFKYTPEVAITPVTRDRASYATPEHAMMSQFSAMLAGDFDWWLSGWDQNSQAFIKQQMVVQKRQPDDWRGIWAKALKGEQGFLLERIETGPFGPYIMMRYSLRNKLDVETFNSSMAMKFEAGRWVSTQELAQDPLFHYYGTGQDRVTLTVR